jgi:hypothetical protein
MVVAKVADDIEDAHFDLEPIALLVQASSTKARCSFLGPSISGFACFLDVSTMLDDERYHLNHPRSGLKSLVRK